MPPTTTEKTKKQKNTSALGTVGVVIMACGAMEQQCLPSGCLPTFAVAICRGVGSIMISICRTLNCHLIKSQSQRKNALKSLQGYVFFSLKNEKYEVTAFPCFTKSGVRNSS